MNKVYNLIKISMPKKEDNYLIFELKTNINIVSLGLYNHHNEEQKRIPVTAYSKDNLTLRISPLEIDMPNSGELLLGAETDDGVSYFKFPERQAQYFWESYFDYGIAPKAYLNTYVYINLAQKISFINSVKMELDTNILRIPYTAMMEEITLSRKEFSFKAVLSFDKIRFSPDKSKIKPLFSLVDHEVQDFISISDFIIVEKEGKFNIRGNIKLPEGAHIGNYSFAFEVVMDGQTYLLNVYQIKKQLFDHIHPYTNDRFITQNYDCELFWFDREGIIFRINKPVRKKNNLPLFGDYSFDKKLSKKAQEKWDAKYQAFEKEWIHRSSIRKF